MKPRPHKQQWRSNVRLCRSNIRFCGLPKTANNVGQVYRKISSFRQSRNKLSMFNLFRLCRKDEISLLDSILRYCVDSIQERPKKEKTRRVTKRSSHSDVQFFTPKADVRERWQLRIAFRVRSKVQQLFLLLYTCRCVAIQSECLMFVFISTHADRQCVDISFTLCLCVCVFTCMCVFVRLRISPPRI